MLFQGFSCVWNKKESRLWKILVTPKIFLKSTSYIRFRFLYWYNSKPYNNIHEPTSLPLYRKCDVKSSIRSRTLLHKYIEWQRATAFFHLRCVRDDDLPLELAHCNGEFSSEVLVHSDYRILILGPKIRQSWI